MPLGPKTSRRLKPLVWPLAALAVAGLANWGAETAAGRYQAYGVYGLARPVADLLLVVGGLWLIAALVRLAFGRAHRPD